MHPTVCRLLAAGCIATAAAPCTAKSLSVPSGDHPSVGAALSRAQSGDTVWVDDGVYREKVLLSPGVVLKSRELFGATLDGQGRGTVVTLAQGSTVEGFEITNGTIGVVSKSSAARIVMCRIARNSETGIMCVGHLPEIRDNVIAFNKGSGIQGWDVRVTTSTISHNTIVHNENHGIALGGNSDVIVENCIVAFNGQYGLKSEAPTVTVPTAKTSERARLLHRISEHNQGDTDNESRFTRIAEHSAALRMHSSSIRIEWVDKSHLRTARCDHYFIGCPRCIQR